MVTLWRQAVKNDPHAGLVVVLHGRGADEHDLEPVIGRLPRTFRYVSVRGFVSVDGGGFTWFENRGIAQPIAKSVRRSVTELRTWLDREAPQPAACYVLGFSAGMMMAGALLLADPQRFAGAILLSGALPFESGIAAEPEQLRDMPIFYGHGSADDVIPAALVRQSRTYLCERSGALVTANDYPHGHTISLPQTQDIAAWLRERR